MEENATKYVYNTIVIEDPNNLAKGLKKISRRVARQNRRLALVAVALTACVILNRLEMNDIEKAQREIKELINKKGD